MQHIFLSRLFQTLQRIEEWTLAYGIIIIAVVTIANVFCRTILNASLTFAEELAQFFIIFVTFTGISYATSKGRHIRMSAVYDQLGEKPRKALMVIITGTTSVLMFLMAYYSLRYISTLRSLGTVSSALQVPLYLVYCIAPIGFVLAGVQYGFTVVRNAIEEDVYVSYERKDEYEEAPPSML
jgi:TRAP-type C4-dicarboxylate transport system permease small subunit